MNDVDIEKIILSVTKNNPDCRSLFMSSDVKDKFFKVARDYKANGVLDLKGLIDTVVSKVKK